MAYDVKAFRVDWYPHAAFTDFSTLKAEDIGVLMQIINLIYMHNEPVENDAQYIGRMCGLQKAKTHRIIHKLINKKHIHLTSDDKLAKKRCQQELKAVRDRMEKNSKNGKKGAKARWGSELDQQDSDSQAIDETLASTKTSNITNKNTSTSSFAVQGEPGGTISDNQDSVERNGNRRKRYDIDAHLSDEARQEARMCTQGWDLQHLYRLYNKRINSGEIASPDFPNKAFPAWCLKYTKGKPPP